MRYVSTPCTQISTLLVTHYIQTNALNKQGNLNEFFDITAGSGTFEPRKQQAYTSKRLQQVVADFRKQQRQGQGMSSGSEETEAREGSDSEREGDGEEEGAEAGEEDVRPAGAHRVDDEVDDGNVRHLPVGYVLGPKGRLW